MLFECTECGKKFELFIPPTQYLYRYKTMYQCSYTCNEHIKLRYRVDKLSEENFSKYTERCEESMRSQNKKILHPIKL